MNRRKKAAIAAVVGCIGLGLGLVGTGTNPMHMADPIGTFDCGSESTLAPGLLPGSAGAEPIQDCIDIPS